MTLYADNNLVQSRCSVELQSYIDILVTLFERVGLRTKFIKINTMVYILGWIRTCQSWEIYNNDMEGHTHRAMRALLCGI